jgi:predicted amidophosphoribosyltransferase
MTELLEKALAEVSKLSAEEQDAVAALILDVLEDERQWELAFATSQDKLAKLAEKVRKDIRAGRVIEMRPDEL